MTYNVAIFYFALVTITMNLNNIWLVTSGKTLKILLTSLVLTRNW